MKWGKAYIVALVAATTIGCASGEAQWAGTVTDSAGVAIVENTDFGMWGDAGGWTLEEELKIGSLEGDIEYQFGQVGWIAVGSDGAIYVLDAQAQNVKVYSPDGAYLRTIAGPGGGPGELGRGAGFLVMAPGDTLLVPDMGNQRVNRYAPDGTVIGSTRLSLEDGIPLQWRAAPGGTLARQVRPLNLPNQPTTDSMDVIVSLNTDGSVRDTLKRFPSGKTFSFAGGAPEFNLYSAEPVWALANNGKLLFGVNDDYRIGVYASGGTLERVITMPFTSREVSEPDRDAVMRSIEKLWKDAGVPPAALAQLKSAVHFAEFFPAFANVQPGPNSTIWIQHIQSAADLTDEELESFNLLEDSGAPDWDVFDVEGRYLGAVRMPDRFAPRVFVGDKIYGVWRDDLDVQYVMRLRIVGMDAAE